MSSVAGSLRYEQVPVLQSVCAYGSETLVPNNDLCRLSYYLKCCVVGCGINIGIDDALLDYMNAHHLSTEQQQKILRYSFSDLSVVNLMNRAFILDDRHVLLPQGTLNTFFEFKTASTYFSIDTFTVATGQQVYVHKVMLCTLKWMREYYLEPFVRYQQGIPMIEIYATPVAEEDELSYAVGGDDYSQQGMVVTPVLDHGRITRSRLFRTCCACLESIRIQEQPAYRCTQCPAAELCEDCYDSGRHDQTHRFERICRTSAESLPPRVETLQDENMSILPDVPIAIAIAIPIEQTLPFAILKSSEPVMPSICHVACAKSSGQKRHRASSVSPFQASTGYQSHHRHRKPFVGRVPTVGSDNIGGGVATSE